MQTQVVTAQQMRDFDRRATEEYGIPSLILMENAGRAVDDAAKEMLGGDVRSKKVLIVAGSGNNGGDGFVAARHLHNAGAEIVVAYYGDRNKAIGDALVNIEIAEKMGLVIDPNHGDICKNHYDLVIDALLGTGIKGKVRAREAEIISCINASHSNGAKVLAVDIPSGVDADTGVILNAAVVADMTISFALPKIGLLTYPGAQNVGLLRVVDISIPKDMLKGNAHCVYINDSFSEIDVARRSDSHKGTFGHVAIVAGSVGMTGAATLAAEGVLRIGTGLVTLAVPLSLNDIMETKVTEAMTIPVKEGNARAFGMASLDGVLEIIEKRDAVVIGPGFGRDQDTIAFTQELVRQIKKPAIIDADALFALSQNVNILKKCEANIVITPHPGEMATFLGTTVAEVQSKRLEVARNFAKEFGVTVVLKGAGTVIAYPDGTAFINTTGTPGMATGGTGDVLSGMIGGLLAQHRQNECVTKVARAAVYLHGRAGEMAAEKLGVEAMLASDMVACIGDAIYEHKSIY